MMKGNHGVRRWALTQVDHPCVGGKSQQDIRGSSKHNTEFCQCHFLKAMQQQREQAQEASTLAESIGAISRLISMQVMMADICRQIGKKMSTHLEHFLWHHP